MKPRAPRTRRRGHRDLADRFLAPLRPRRELFEALWNFALFKTNLRRRRAKIRPTFIDRVNVWCQLRQSALVGRYTAHMKHLGESPAMSLRTLRRHLAAFKAMGLVKIVQDTYYDKKRREWVMRPNVYAITREGQLWIKTRVDGTKFPKVV